MASENLVKDLWELIQKNSSDEVSYNDFEIDLNKSLNLPKDESDRAIALMIAQAEINPNIIGESKGGAFIISSSFAAKVVSTIKYENKYIPGKNEYEVRNVGENLKSELNIGVILLTPQLIDNLIEDYDKLSDDDKKYIAQNYSSFSEEQKEKFSQKLSQKLRDRAQKAESQDEKDFYEEQAKATETARENTKTDAKSNMEKLTIIAVLEKMYPEIVLELKESGFLEENSLDEIYRKVKEVAEQKMIEASAKIEVESKKRNFFDIYKETVDYKKLITLRNATSIINFLQNREYLKFNITLEEFLQYSIEQMQVMVLNASLGKFKLSFDNQVAGTEQIKAVDAPNGDSNTINMPNNENTTNNPTAPSFYTHKDMVDALHDFVGGESVLHTLLDRYKDIDLSVHEQDGMQSYSIDSSLRKMTNRTFTNVESSGIFSDVENLAGLGEDKNLGSNRLSNYINQIPMILKRAGFETNDVISSIEKYIRILENVEFDDNDDKDSIIEKIEKEIERVECTTREKEILDKLGELDYLSMLDDLMIDQKSILIESLRKSIKNPQLIQTSKNVSFELELEKVFEEYFRENSVDIDVSGIQMNMNQTSNDDVLKNATGKVPRILMGSDNDIRENDEDQIVVYNENDNTKKFAKKQVVDVISGVKAKDITEQNYLIISLVSKEKQKINGDKKQENTTIDPNGNIVKQVQSTDSDTGRDDDEEH